MQAVYTTKLGYLQVADPQQWVPVFFKSQQVSYLNIGYPKPRFWVLKKLYTICISIFFNYLNFYLDLKSMMSLSLSRSSSTGSFSKEYSHYNSNNGSHRKHHKRSPSSDESGIEDKSTISVSDKSSVTTSMISSAATPLSPGINSYLPI